MVKMILGIPVTVTTEELNGGRYAGRRGTIIEQLKDGRVVVRLWKFTPGLDAPNGELWLRNGEYEFVDPNYHEEDGA